MKYDHL